jgi:hypothetical protein
MSAGKGYAYSANEYYHLAQAWMETSRHVQDGTKQTSEIFWGKVYAAFVKKAPADAPVGSYNYRTANADKSASFMVLRTTCVAQPHTPHNTNQTCWFHTGVEVRTNG